MTTVDITASPYNAVGDAKWYNLAFTLNTVAGVTTLGSPTSIWVSGDAGKSIVIGNAGLSAPQGGVPLSTTILTVAGDGKSVTVGPGATVALPPFGRGRVIVAWGTPCNTAFTNFRNDFVGQTVTLTIPAGTYLLTSGISQIFAGITNLTVNGTGATICGGQWSLGSGYMMEEATAIGDSPFHTMQARVQSVAAGATSITCVPASRASRFIPGEYAFISGHSLQFGGYPPSYAVYENLHIVSANSTTGVVTFTPALANSYLSTWVDWGPSGSLDYGGPATLYAWTNGVASSFGNVGPSWNHTAVYNDLTIVHDAQFSIMGLSNTFNDCVFEGDFGPYPTMAGTMAFNSCSCPDGNVEYDKIVKNVTFTNCTWGGTLNFQSMDDVCILDSSSFGAVVGTPRVLTIRNGCTMGLLQVAPIYGFSTTLIVTDSVISQFNDATTHITGQVYQGGGGAPNGLNHDFPDFSGGVMTVPNAFFDDVAVEKWAIPGNRVFWYDTSGGVQGVFKILDMSQDASNAYIHTDWVGGYPPTNSGKNSIWVHPAQSVTFSNVTGCREVVDLSGAPAGSPLWSYTKRTHTGTTDFDEYQPLYGVVTKVVVNVTQAYTGVALSAITASLNNSAYFKVSDGSSATFHPIINLRVLGTRTIDVSGGYPATWTGTQSGDTLPTITEPIWAGSLYQMGMPNVSSEDPSLRPVFTVEFITNQGFGRRTFTLTFT